jgi:hypothetical protein
VHAHPQAGFNGLALYNLGHIASTAGASNCSFEGAWHCEHVAFQQCLGTYGLRVGLAPSLVQGCGKDHMHRLLPKLQRAHVTAEGAFQYPPASWLSRGVSSVLGNLTGGHIFG